MTYIHKIFNMYARVAFDAGIYFHQGKHFMIDARVETYILFSFLVYFPGSL